MSALSKGGTHMKGKLCKVTFITVTGMAIMKANGLRDQRADGKEMMTKYFEYIEHKYNVQKDVNKLEPGNGRHETCMIEIEMGRRRGGKPAAYKEERRKDFSRKGIQQYSIHSPKSPPRRGTRTRERSQGPI